MVMYRNGVFSLVHTEAVMPMMLHCCSFGVDEQEFKHVSCFAL